MIITDKASRATLAVVLMGVLLRLVQWLGSPSLFFDELQLTRNLLERDLPQLLTSGLDYSQVAPIGYLALTKVSVLLFGSGERVLRLVPLLASVASLVLFRRLAHHLLKPTAAFVATAAFALNPLLISLAGVVKQYAVDVLVVVLVLLALERLWDSTRSRRSRTLLAAGVGILGFFSIPVVIVQAAGMAAVLCRAWTVGELRSREGRLSTGVPLLVWGAVAGAGALVARSLLTPDTSAFMTGFWQSRTAFAPPITDYPTWLFDYSATTLLPGFFFLPYFGRDGAIEALLRPLMGIWVLFGGLAFSVFALFRARGTAWTIAVVFPLMAALGLSRFEIYPLHPRTSVLLVPSLILLAGASVDALADVASRSAAWPRVAIAALATVPLFAILWNRPPVFEVQATRQVIAELARRRAPGDRVFVPRLSSSALGYYGPRVGLEGGVVVGEEYGLPAKLSELEALRGEPSVWVLFTLAEDRDLYLCYLDEIGTEIDSVVLESGGWVPVSMHRYDLSDERRWLAADLANPPRGPDVFDGNPARCRRRRG